MAEQSILREFLVSLGFSVDERGLKNFGNTLGTATQTIERFGATVATMTIGAGVMLDKFSESLEGLYFSAKRVGTSASSLRAFEQASRNFGASAGEAQAAAEGLAQALFINPGNVGLLSGLLGRVGAHISTGPNADVDNLQNLAKVFQSMSSSGPTGGAVAYQWAQQFGIDYKEFRAMISPGFNANVDQQKGLNAGIDKAAASAHVLQTQVRNVETKLTVAGAKLADNIIKDLLPALNQFQGWMDRFSPKAIKSLSDDFGHFMGWVTGSHPKLDALAKDFEFLNDKTHGWLGNLLLVQGALAAVGGGSILPGLAGGVIGGVGGALVRAAVGGGGGAATAAAGAAGGGGLLGSFLLALAPLSATIMAMAAIPKFMEAVKGMSAGQYFSGMGSSIFDNFKGLAAGFGIGSYQNFQGFTGLYGVAPHTRYDNLAAVGNGGAGTVINDHRVVANITVDGSRSPAETGKAVVDAIQRLQRNVVNGVPQ